MSAARPASIAIIGAAMLATAPARASEAPKPVQPAPVQPSTAKPSAPAKPVQKVDAAHVSHAAGPPLAGGPAPGEKADCAGLDAAETPACSDQAMRDALLPGPQKLERAPEPKPGPSKPEPKPEPAAKATTDAKPKPSAGTSTPSAFDAVLRGAQARPILAGAAGGVVALGLLGGAWALVAAVRRPRGAIRSAARGASDRPTPYRRDLVLIGPTGEGARLAGGKLDPSATLGSDRGDALQLKGEGVAARHVEVWVSAGRLMLRKAADAPVFLNDRLLKDVAPEVVSTGDHLRLGGTSFTIMID